MKLGIAMAAAILIGVVVGVGSAAVKLHLAPWDGELPHHGSIQSATLQPKAHVDQTHYDFGTMDYALKGHHEFHLHNAGMAPLVIGKGSATCSCLLADLAAGQLAPGESTQVTLEWQSKGKTGPYYQSATILTNDPEKPRIALSVSGRMLAALEVIPKEITFNDLSTADRAGGTARVYNFRPESLDFTGFDLLDPATADRFDVRWRPLTEAEVKSQADARSGYEVSVSSKSALPLGAIRQTIRLKTSLKDHPTIELPILGMVHSDIALFGRGWNNEDNVLEVGAVTGEGAKRSLILVARGAHRKDVRFEIVSVTPKFLEVELAPTMEMGTARRTPLSIRIPPGTPAGSYLGPPGNPRGEITLKTNHPDLPTLKIRVAFTVEG